MACRRRRGRRRARDGGGGRDVGARALCALEARPILRREQRGEHETNRASALRERVGRAKRDGGAARGATVGRHDVEARFGRCSSVHVILATAVACSVRPISTSAGVATSLATVRIDTETSEPSASSAARASAPGSGVAAS